MPPAAVASYMLPMSISIASSAEFFSPADSAACCDLEPSIHFVAEIEASHGPRSESPLSRFPTLRSAPEYPPAA